MIMNSKKLVVEFIGTFALIFIGAGAVSLGASLVEVALAHGLVVAVFAYAYGPVSGSHINPAVTFGVALYGKISWRDAVGYWVAQFLGGIAGAAALVFVLGGSSSGLGATTVAEPFSNLQGLTVEAILTFLLVNTVLRTAVKGEGGNMAGLAIGLTLTLSILMGGPVTGASLNPARTLGPAIFTDNLDSFWIYLSGTFIGAALAAGVSKYLD
ncbi:MAG: aquaporin family protein [Chloroflexi bacterium]|nr:aquaporin family protein [Chloroflexota bacterium]